MKSGSVDLDRDDADHGPEHRRSESGGEARVAAVALHVAGKDGGADRRADRCCGGGRSGEAIGAEELLDGQHRHG